MATVAFLVLAGTQTREGLGRVVNAMIGTKEFKDGVQGRRGCGG
jgi:hypothetical protein